MRWTEGDYVEHYDFPGPIWRVFEVTQIGTVTLNLIHVPEEFTTENRFLFEVLKSGDFVDPDQVCRADQKKVAKVLRAQG